MTNEEIDRLRSDLFDLLQIADELVAATDVAITQGTVDLPALRAALVEHRGNLLTIVERLAEHIEPGAPV